MLDSFGARLRRQREQQNVPLATIAEQTKIKVSLLEALERDDVSRWPSGIFRRAYVRAYAHAIGLSPDEVLREFLERYPDPSEESEPVAAIATAHGIASGASGSPTRLHFIVDSALASLSRLKGSSSENLARARFTSSAPEAAPSRPDLPALEQTSADTERDAVVDDRVTAGNPDVDDAAHQSPPREPRLLEFARVCTELAKIERADQMQSWLQKAASVLDAQGLIVWVWHRASGTLAPALVHGYSDQVIAQLPAVTTDADNVTAAAFRSGVACVQPGTEHVNGALAVPLPTPAGSSGVLAIELRDGAERSDSVLAVASVFAAMLAQLIGERPGAEVEGVEPEPVAAPAAREVRSSTAPAVEAIAADRPRSPTDIE